MNVINVMNVANRMWVLLFIALWACVNNEDEVKNISARKATVDEGTDIEAYMSNTGKMKARLRAPKMLRFEDSGKVVFPNSLHVDFFNDSTVIENQMDALYGEYYEAKGKVYLKDSVRVFNKTGDTLFCQELWWDQASQMFNTDKPVRIHRPDMIMNGIGLSAPQDFKYFEMYKITNSTLRVNQ